MRQKPKEAGEEKPLKAAEAMKQEYIHEKLRKGHWNAGKN